MSADENLTVPDEIEAVASAPEPAVPVEPAGEGADVAVDQLRALICGLVVGLLLSCGAFTLYIFKQTRTLKYQIQTRATQLQQAREFEKMALPAVQELARYSVGKPELLAIFSRHRMQLGQNVGPVGGGSSQ